jgi:biotin/methionine sulfoxide reductase
VRLSDGIRSDCLSLPTGAWYDPQIVDGAYLDVHGNPNALTIDKGTSRLSQGNIAHTTVVKAEKWKRPLPKLSITDPPVIAPRKPAVD